MSITPTFSCFFFIDFPAIIKPVYHRFLRSSKIFCLTPKNKYTQFFTFNFSKICSIVSVINASYIFYYSRVFVMKLPMQKIIIGARGSKLSLIQTDIIKDLLQQVLPEAE